MSITKLRGGTWVGRLGPPFLAWRAEEAKARRLCLVVTACFAWYMLIYLGATISGGGAHPFGDFFALWSWARFILDHPAAQIYDDARLHAEQVALGMDPHALYLFGYPPSFMLALWPLGLMTIAAACALWILATLTLYLWAVAGDRSRWRTGILALLAPTTTITIVSGQSGFLAAALLVGGLRTAAKRPLLAGVLFGLLTYKPQLGLLVPIALISARLWRSLAAACATVLALVVLSSAFYGWTSWTAWTTALSVYASKFQAASTDLHRLMPTVMANLERLGVPDSAARLAQLAVAILVALVVWRSFRRGATAHAGAVLLAGTLLTTPYAFVYDMPIVTAAVLLFIEDRLRSDARFGPGEIAVVMLTLFVPAFMPLVLPWPDLHLPLSSVSMLLLVGMIVRSQRRLMATEEGRSGQEKQDPAGITSALRAKRWSSLLWTERDRG